MDHKFCHQLAWWIMWWWEIGGNEEWKFAQGCGLWLFGEKLSIYVNFNGDFNEFVMFVQYVVCIF